MKKILIIAMLLVPIIVSGKGIEDMLLGIVTSKISHKNPQAGQIITALLGSKNNKHNNYQNHNQNHNPHNQGSYNEYPNSGAWTAPVSTAELIAQGRWLGNAGRLSEALNCFVQVTELEPDNLAGHYYSGITYSLLGNREAAIYECELMQQMAVQVKSKADKLLMKIQAME